MMALATVFAFTLSAYAENDCNRKIMTGCRHEKRFAFS